MDPMAAATAVLPADDGQVRSALARLRDGRGGAVFVAAHHGPDRRAAAQAIAAQAGALGARVLVGHTPAATDCPDFGPVAEALASAGRTPGTVDLGALGGADGPLAGLVLDAGAAPAVEPSVPVVCEAVLRALAALSVSSPVTIVLHDLHLADRKTLAVVEYVASNLDVLPILVVCTFDGEAPSTVPLLAERGVVVRAGSGLDDLLATVGDTCRRVLHAVAAVGSASDTWLLAAAAEVEENDVRSSLREARSTGLLRETNDPVADLVFADDAAARAVMADLLPPERVALADRALAALDVAHPDLDGRWRERAARLCLLAAKDADAQRHLLASATAAAGSGALDRAMALLAEARAIAGDGADGSAEVLEAELLVELAAGRATRAIAAGEALVRMLADRGASAERLTAARLALATARHRAGLVLEDGDGCVVTSALATAPLQLRGDLLEAESRAWRAETAAAAATATRVAAAAAAGRDPDLELDALELLARTLVATDGRAAVGALERARLVAQRAGLTVAAAQARVRGASLRAVASLDISELVAAHEAAVAAGSPGLAAEADFRMGVVLSLLDRIPDALSHLERATRVARTEGGWYLPLALAFLGGCHARDGAAEAAEAALREADATAGGRPDAAAAILGEGRAMAALAAGAISSARVDLAVAARAAASAQPLSWSFLGLHRLLEATGDRASGDEPTPVAATWTRVFRGYDAMAQAVTAGGQGDRAAAERAVEEGEAYLVAAPWHHHVALLIVAPKALRQGWGTPERWLRTSLAFFDSTGRHPLATRCRTTLAEAGLIVPRRGRGISEVPASLAAVGITSRELDVIELVRAGRSNSEIARELIVSLHTVKSHLTHVFQKTGVQRRNELAARIDALAAAGPGTRPHLGTEGTRSA